MIFVFDQRSILDSIPLFRAPL